MNLDHGVRGFLALTFPRSVTTIFESVQREIGQKAKENDCRVRLIPRQTLTLPLEDLGDPAPESYEALDLAMTRSLRDVSRFSIDVEGVHLWTPPPANEEKAFLRAMVKVGIEPLEEIRTRIQENLKRYGFPVTDGKWDPHIPLAQVVKGDFPDSEIGLKLDAPFEVRDISVLCLTFNHSGRSRFRVRKKYGLPEAMVGGDDNQSDTALSEAIGQALDERLAALPAMKPRISQRKRQHGLNDDELGEELVDPEECEPSDGEIVD